MSVCTEPAAAWHALPVETCLERLGSVPGGLGSEEAARRLTEHGPNEIEARRGVSAWALLLEQFQNVLILILLVAAVLSAVLGHGVEAVAIGVIVLFAALLGFVQEYRAERSMEALREMAAPTGTVIRDGEEVEVPARVLVPGDLILLAAGDRVPADARLVEAVNLCVDEAPLTGESVPVEKQTAPLPGDGLALGDRSSMVYAGTAVTYGRGRAVITGTGMRTEFGKVARMLQTVEVGRTPLQENLARVGTLLARAALLIVAVIVALGLLRGQPFLEMFIFGIALAVAVVPEALPAVITISLAIGVRRMLRRNALVRRLPAVETLGGTSVICSDKTGTLTRDEMTVRRLHVGTGTLEVSGAGYEPVGAFTRDGAPVPPTGAIARLLEAAALASDAHVARREPADRWVVKGDPTEGALVVAAAKAGLHKADLDGLYPRVGEIPFTSETKRMTTLHRTPGGVVAFSKGAPEVILDSCVRVVCEEGERPLDAATREDIRAASQQMAAEALRVLAIATRRDATLTNAETEMTLLGLVGMIDPPRPEARAALRRCEEAGIRVIMITGDHPLTARAVANELGILRHGRVATGAELDVMEDEDLRRQVEEIEVYARVSPAHKLRVVGALQERGHVAAMTGDGVNDAPALKRAAIGIAMGLTGTDVTKEAAAMTLTDDNFASIVAAVEEGRGIFGNIKKYLMYLLSSNIGEIGLMAGAALLGLPLPLTAVMLLYVNLATDGLPALALAVDPPAPDLMRHPPRDPRAGIFTRPVVTLMIVGGLWSTLVNLGMFTWALGSGRGLPEAMTLTLVSLVLVEFVKAYNFRSDRHSVLVRPFANRWLNLAVAWEVALLTLVVHVPFLNAAFNTVPLSGSDWLTAGIPALTISPVLDLAKGLERRGWFGALDWLPGPREPGHCEGWRVRPGGRTRVDRFLMRRRDSMSLFRTILVAADFSECSREALRVACSLTHEDQTRLIVLHVVGHRHGDVRPPFVGESAGPVIAAPETIEGRGVLRDRLRAAYVPERPLCVEYRICNGDAAKIIIAVAEETDCELIVLGTHGRTGWSRLLTGSVAETVLRKAHCPVLALRSPGLAEGSPSRGAGHHVRTILHPTDLTGCSSVMMPVIHALVRDYGARLILLHVVTTIDLPHFGGPAPIQDPDACEEALKGLRGRLEGSDLKYPVETRLRLGDTATEILRAVHELECDLLLLGTHGRSGLGRLLLGSVAEEVLRKVSCPVLILKTPAPVALSTASGAIPSA